MGYLDNAGLAHFWGKIKGYVADHGGGTVNWDQINGRPNLSTVSSMVVAPITLPSIAWDQNKQQVIPVDGILADENAQLIIPMPKSSSESMYNSAGVKCVFQAKGALTFQADTEPTEDISVNIYVFGAAEIKDEFVGTFEWWSPHMTGNTTPPPYAAAASSTYPVQNNPRAAYQAFDGNKATTWHSNRGANGWISFDFGEKTIVNGIRLSGSPDNAYATFPSTGTIEGSDDGNTWTEITSFSGLPTPVSSDFREHLFDNAVRYRYYRIANLVSNYSSGGYYIQIAEIEFSVLQQGGAQ